MKANSQTHYMIGHQLSTPKERADDDDGIRYANKYRSREHTSCRWQYYWELNFRFILLSTERQTREPVFEH